MSVNVGDVATSVGKGLFAGGVGTAVMTISSTLEMKIRVRPGSSAPAEAAAKVLGVEPKGEAEEARFSNLVHWGYGTSWGAARGLIGTASLEGPMGWRAPSGSPNGATLTPYLPLPTLAYTFCPMCL
jgi:hypothetical protein